MDSCQSQCSWQVSARAVVRSGVGLVSGVDRSPALRLLWVLSAPSVPAAPPSCAHRHVARLTSRRPCCSLHQVSTAQLPLIVPPARLQGVRRNALPPARLTSAQLNSPLGPQLAGFARSHLSRRTSSQTPHATSSWYGRPEPPDLALLDLPRAGWAVRSAVPSLCDSHLSHPAVDPAFTQLDLQATGH